MFRYNSRVYVAHGKARQAEPAMNQAFKIATVLLGYSQYVTVLWLHVSHGERDGPSVASIKPAMWTPY